MDKKYKIIVRFKLPNMTAYNKISQAINKFTKKYKIDLLVYDNGVTVDIILSEPNDIVLKHIDTFLNIPDILEVNIIFAFSKHILIMD